jgi:hypothetical protein
VNPYRYNPKGRIGVEGFCCYRCGRVPDPFVLHKQDDVTVCSDCLYTHSKRDWEKLNPEEVDTPVGARIGGRTG